MRQSWINLSWTLPQHSSSHEVSRDLKAKKVPEILYSRCVQCSLHQLYTSPDRKLWRHRCAILSNVTNFHPPKNDTFTFSALYSGLAQWAQLKNYLKKTKKVKNEDTEDSEVINITTRRHCCSFTPVPVPVKSGRGTKSTWIFIHWRRPRIKILKVMMRS